MVIEDKKAAVARDLEITGKRIRAVRESGANELRLAKPKVLAAIEADLPYRRIKELTGIAVSTLHKWADEAGLVEHAEPKPAGKEENPPS